LDRITFAGGHLKAGDAFFVILTRTKTLA
jgi:hypothetical protein